MFGSEYYCLVAGLKELALDAIAKDFDARVIIDDILSELSERDAKAVELLYTYFDCENLCAARASRQQHNPLGLLSREQIEAELSQPTLLCEALSDVIIAYGEAADFKDSDSAKSFERALFEAYYGECAKSTSQFIVRWAQIDCNIRNVAAAISARIAGKAIDDVVVGGGDVVEQLRRSSAADFGLRGELPYIDTLISAISDEENIVEKEHKIDNIRWSEVDEASTFDYFNLNAIMAYLVKLNIVARWSLLDVNRGREMLERLMAELSAKDKINK